VFLSVIASLTILLVRFLSRNSRAGDEIPNLLAIVYVIVLCLAPVPVLMLTVAVFALDLAIALIRCVLWSLASAVSCGIEAGKKRFRQRRYRWDFHVPAPQPPALPPPDPQLLKLQAIADARRQLEMDLMAAQTFDDPDERDAFVAGAKSRMRQRIGRLTQQE
jgi:hypothetical protein